MYVCQEIVLEINKIGFIFLWACMNIVWIFENNYVDPPTKDTRLKAFAMLAWYMAWYVCNSFLNGK